MKTILLSLFALTVCFSLSASAAHDDVISMTFNNGAIQAQAHWLKGPQVGDESILMIDWSSGTDRRAIELPGTFQVRIIMPDMPEMKSPPTQITRILDGGGNPVLGSYQVSSIYFTMGGDWKVRVEVTYPDGSAETRSFPLELSGKMKM